jgi:hypothetical protein
MASGTGAMVDLTRTTDQVTGTLPVRPPRFEMANTLNGFPTPLRSRTSHAPSVTVAVPITALLSAR